MVEHTHEQYKIEFAGNLIDVVDRMLLELDAEPEGLGGKTCLIQIAVVYVNAEDPLGPAALHLQGIKAGITADVQDGRAAQVRRDLGADASPFDVGKISQEMVGRSGNAMQVEIMKPVSQFGNAAGELTGVCLGVKRSGSALKLAHGKSCPAVVTRPDIPCGRGETGAVDCVSKRCKPRRIRLFHATVRTQENIQAVCHTKKISRSRSPRQSLPIFPRTRKHYFVKFSP